MVVPSACDRREVGSCPEIPKGYRGIQWLAGSGRRAGGPRSIRNSMTSASNTSGSLQLPALKSLGDLAEAQIVLAQDNREQLPLRFEHLPSVVCCLPSADYSIVGFESEFGIERKSIEDLVGCCTGENRQRFERELHRLL